MEVEIYKTCLPSQSVSSQDAINAGGSNSHIESGTAWLQPKTALVVVEETLFCDPTGVEGATSFYSRIVVVPSLQAGISTA